MSSGQNVGRQTLMTPEVSSITHHVQGSRNDPVLKSQLLRLHFLLGPNSDLQVASFKSIWVISTYRRTALAMITLELSYQYPSLQAPT